jgi:hypothetical protein
MSAEEYLASIDWLWAAIVSAVVVVVGLVLLRFLMATSSEVGTMLPTVRDATGRAILDARSGMPVDSWVCTVCRSVNTPTASHCYRGCGTRDDVGQPMPQPVAGTGDMDGGTGPT